MIKPAGHRVLVKPDAPESVSKGGIVLVTDKRDKEAQTTGTLIRVGPNAWRGFDNGEPWAKEGDKIYFAKYAGGAVYDGDEELRLMNDEDVTAVIEPDVEFVSSAKQVA